MLNLRLIESGGVDRCFAHSPHSTPFGNLGNEIEIGAAVTQNKLMAWPQLALKLPLLAKALPFVGHFQTRNRGTVCGSIAHADPSSELPLALAVLEGQACCAPKNAASGWVAAEAFQKDMLTTLRCAG